MDKINLVIDLLGFISAIVIFMISSAQERRATDEQTRRDSVRETLKEFAAIRRTHQMFESELTPNNRNEILRSYLSDLERFAVGCNLKAYTIEVVNSMSGGMLVSQYNRYFRSFINERRKIASLEANVKPWEMYKEYEKMIRDVFALRGLTWNEPWPATEEQFVLDKFINMPVSSSENVFAMFRTIKGAVEKHGEGKEGYLYVPGERLDRCLLVAHADTFFDEEYQQKKINSKVGYHERVYYSESEESSIGADDRAGCAILWLLRNSGHSLLILDGEEHGQIGAHFLQDSEPVLFDEINNHTFMIQLDRKGSHEYKCYDLPVSKEFVKYIQKSTGFTMSNDKGKTDICTLCKSICGTNLSVGYYDPHKSTEKLNYDEWYNTFTAVQTMLQKPLKKFPLQ